MSRCEQRNGNETDHGNRAPHGWLAAGGLVGAVLTSACCLGPLALLTIGISGSWIGYLVALEPHKPLFAAIALGFIGLGLHHAYLRPRIDCEPGVACARRRPARIAMMVLWLASGLVLIALSIEWWAPLFY